MESQGHDQDADLLEEGPLESSRSGVMVSFFPGR